MYSLQYSHSESTLEHNFMDQFIDIELESTIDNFKNIRAWKINRLYLTNQYQYVMILYMYACVRVDWKGNGSIIGIPHKSFDSNVDI